ncbi:MAG: hypothetical protein EXQ89_01360 [Rhodospirillaceae bacterium]|nr:hypothetical protein [Rhodospirillaceae bacterium]
MAVANRVVEDNVKRSDPQWRRNAKGKFFRLADIDPPADMPEGGGVYVIWHGGVKPQWIVVGHNRNLRDHVEKIKKDQEVRSYEVNGGVFVTWSPIIENHRDGVVNYLIQVLKPVKSSVTRDANAKPIAVYIPG